MTPYGKIKTAFERGEDFKITGVYSEGMANTFAFFPEWIWTEKVDGTNVRVIFEPGQPIKYRGRTDKAEFSQRNIEALMGVFETLHEEIEDRFPNGVTFYGELCGPKIQKGGGNYGDEQQFICFDVYRHEIPEGPKNGGHPAKFYDFHLVQLTCSGLAIQTVPVVGKGSILALHDYMESREMTSFWGDFRPEGVVARIPMEAATPDGERGMVKLKFKDFPGEGR